jgi:hypothetical protein
MLRAQLDRIHTIVGRIATEFSEVEMLWYLIFTCLLGNTPRAAVDAIFNNLKSGAQQRQLILDVAATVLDQKSELLASIKRHVEQTKILAGRRNEAVHSIIYIFAAAIPPHIAAGGSSKPSRLNGEQLGPEIAEIYRAILFHQLDMQDLRLQAIRHSNPNANFVREEKQLARAREEIPRTLASDPLLQALIQWQEFPPRP